MPDRMARLPAGIQRSFSKCRMLRATSALALGAFVLTQGPSAHAIAIGVVNETTHDVYMSFGGGSDPLGTMTFPIPLPGGGWLTLPINPNWTFEIPAMTELTGLNVTQWYDPANGGGRIYLSLDQPLVFRAHGQRDPVFQVNAAYPGGATDTNTRFDKVELTVNPNGNSSADLSAVDFFGMRLGIETTKHGATVEQKTTSGAAATILSKLASYSGNDQYAVVQSGGQTLRVISPQTYPAAQYGNNPYASFVPYLTAVQGITTTVDGTYSGPNVGQRGAYSFTAVVQPNLDLLLTGKIAGDTNTHTVLVKAADLKQGLYSNDPVYYLDSSHTPVNNGNDAFDAALSSIFAGFNAGLVGSTVIDTRPGYNGTEFGKESTMQWFDPNNLLSYTELFGALWPGGELYYNQWAAYLSSVSEAYNFPYSDKFAKPLVSLDAPAVDTLVITVLPDVPTPEPSPFQLLLQLPDKATLVPEPSPALPLAAGLGGLGLILAIRRQRPARQD